MKWINEVENPKKELLTSAYWAKSGKGLILNAQNYSCFLWKDSQLCFYLVNALNTYTQEGKNQPIQIIPRKDLKSGFSLEPITPKSNQDYYWYQSLNGWSYGKKDYLEDPFGLMNSQTL